MRPSVHPDHHWHDIQPPAEDPRHGRTRPQLGFLPHRHGGKSIGEIRGRVERTLTLGFGQLLFRVAQGPGMSRVAQWDAKIIKGSLGLGVPLSETSGDPITGELNPLRNRIDSLGERAIADSADDADNEEREYLSHGWFTTSPNRAWDPTSTRPAPS